MSEGFWSCIILIDMDTDMARSTLNQNPLASLWPSFSKRSDLRVSLLKQLCGEWFVVMGRNDIILMNKFFLLHCNAHEESRVSYNLSLRPVLQFVL